MNCYFIHKIDMQFTIEGGIKFISVQWSCTFYHLYFCCIELSAKKNVCTQTRDLSIFVPYNLEMYSLYNFTDYYSFRATFIFKDNKLGVTAKGSQFNEFRSQFGPDDRGFGYIKVMVSLCPYTGHCATNLHFLGCIFSAATMLPLNGDVCPRKCCNVDQCGNKMSQSNSHCDQIFFSRLVMKCPRDPSL